MLSCQRVCMDNYSKYALKKFLWCKQQKKCCVSFHVGDDNLTTDQLFGISALHESIEFSGSTLINVTSMYLGYCTQHSLTIWFMLTQSSVLSVEANNEPCLPTIVYKSTKLVQLLLLEFLTFFDKFWESTLQEVTL